MKNSIGVTELAQFRDCRRKWAWQSLENFNSKSPSHELWLGIGVHKGLEVYYTNGRDIDKGLDAYESWYGSFVETARNTFSETWSNIQDSIAQLYETGKGMLANYGEYDADETLEGGIQYVEHYISVPILDPEGKPTGFMLSGKMDLILNVKGGVWIVDHKTHTRTPDFTTLDIDDQLTAYCYLYWREHGIIPRGVIYNVLLKDVPGPPKVLQNGGLSKAKNQKTTHQLYLNEIEARGLDPDDYAEVLKYIEINWEQYFARGGSSRNLTELESFGKRLYWQLQEIIRVREFEELRYPSPSVYRCSYCQFLAPCKAFEDGGDYMYLLETNYVRGRLM